MIKRIQSARVYLRLIRGRYHGDGLFAALAYEYPDLDAQTIRSLIAEPTK